MAGGLEFPEHVKSVLGQVLTGMDAIEEKKALEKARDDFVAANNEAMRAWAVIEAEKSQVEFQSDGAISDGNLAVVVWTRRFT